MFLGKVIAIGIAVLSLCVAGKVEAQVAPSLPSVPFVIKEAGGPRPFVHVMLNGKPFQHMVRSSAEFYVQTNHDRARSIGITDATKYEAFGITSVGHVSSEGRGKAKLDSLEVGPSISRNVTLDVFEVPSRGWRAC
jgi:hypothetical protein